MHTKRSPQLLCYFPFDALKCTVEIIYYREWEKIHSERAKIQCILIKIALKNSYIKCTGLYAQIKWIDAHEFFFYFLFYIRRNAETWKVFEISGRKFNLLTKLFISSEDRALRRLRKHPQSFSHFRHPLNVSAKKWPLKKFYLHSLLHGCGKPHKNFSITSLWLSQCTEKK